MPNPFGSTPSAFRQLFGNDEPSENAYRTLYQIRSVATSIPLVGSLVTASDRWRYMDDYLGNRGLSYSQIRYPSMTKGGTTNVYSGLNFVSSNIIKLYR